MVPDKRIIAVAPSRHSAYSELTIEKEEPGNSV
jgi:hypothetical protein